MPSAGPTLAPITGTEEQMNENRNQGRAVKPQAVQKHPDE
jgi:hypothetical protein